MAFADNVVLRPAMVAVVLAVLLVVINGSSRLEEDAVAPVEEATAIEPRRRSSGENAVNEVSGVPLTDSASPGEERGETACFSW